MYQQKSKDDVVKKIRSERNLLEKSVSNLTEQEMLLEGVVGEWSVKDILAHLMAWERLFLTWYESGLQGRKPNIAPVDMSGKAITTVNERFFHQYKHWTLRNVLTEFRISYRINYVWYDLYEGLQIAMPRFHRWFAKTMK